MKQSKFLKIGLAAIILSSSLALFACGGQADNSTAYQKVDELVEVINQNQGTGKLFSKSQVYNLSSDYIISSFVSIDDSVYKALFAIPMNYIASHYSVLSALDEMENISKSGKEAIETLKNNVDVMKDEYFKLDAQFQRLKTFSDLTHQKIYEGEIQRFRYQSTDIIGATYNVALSLANVEEEVFDFYSGKVKKETLTQDDSRELRDYLALFVSQDYYTLLLKNCKSTNLSAKVDTINSARASFASFVRTFSAANNLKDLTQNSADETEPYQSKVDHLLKINKLLMEDRKIMIEATNQFSYYDFLLSYNGEGKLDIDQEEGLKNYEDVHVHSIEDYFSSKLTCYILNISSTLV